MKVLLVPAAAVALLAGCSTFDEPYGSYYPGAMIPGGSVYAPAAYANQPYGINPTPYYQGNPYGRPYRDRDGDGVPNSRDRDRDGDGVPNAWDGRPNNPNRR